MEKARPLIRCAGYPRNSDPRKKDSATLESQEKEICRYIANHEDKGYVLEEGCMYPEAMTAYMLPYRERPQLMKLLDDARHGKFDVLIVTRPKSGRFFGFKLHLAVNDQGEPLAYCLMPGNVDDRRPVPFLVKRLRGKLIGDRGYISAPLIQLLFEQGLHLITWLRKNMFNRLMHLSDKLLVRKRAIIETIIDQLKNISKTRAFSPSQSHQFCSSSACRSLCVLPPAQKAFLTS